MTTEWQDVTDPEELFRLKKLGWEIEYCGTAGVWNSWNTISWHTDLHYRARPPKPKTKMVKFLGWKGPTGILYEIAEDSKLCLIGYRRVPSRDFEAEVEDANT